MEATHLVVARFLKPHGIRGAVLVRAMTDEPDVVFAPGRRLWRVDESGRPEGEALVVRRGRAFKGGWLVEFEGLASRTEVEARGLAWLGALREELREPGPWSREGRIWVPCGTWWGRRGTCCWWWKRRDGST
jgi:ribosomal 30S subunit maturation factor RimM